MIEVKIEDNGIKELLESLSEKITNPKPLMREISEIMRDAVEENFEHEGLPKWETLSPKTIKQRKKKGYWPGKILQQTGRLASSIEANHTKDEAVVGTNVKYARIHQFGGMAGRGRKVKISARPFLKLTDKDIEDIKKAIIDYFVNGNE